MNWEPLPEKVKICIYRFAYGREEESTVVDWLTDTLFTLHTHPKVEKVFTYWIDDTPLDMSRNRALLDAQKMGFHFAIFVDSDMAPDYRNRLEGLKAEEDPSAQPFVPNALKFALEHDGPCVVGAPYCCSPPEEKVLVMKWINKETNDPDAQFILEKYERSEIYNKIGFEEVAALPTGMMLIDIRALNVLPKPWFHYEYTDEHHVHKASSEDVVFSRNLSLHGIPQYCFWSAWCGHWKRKLVCKPTPVPIKAVSEALRQTYMADYNKKLDETWGSDFALIREMRQMGVTLDDLKAFKTQQNDLKTPICNRIATLANGQNNGSNHVRSR